MITEKGAINAEHRSVCQLVGLRLTSQMLAMKQVRGSLVATASLQKWVAASGHTLCVIEALHARRKAASSDERG